MGDKPKKVRTPIPAEIERQVKVEAGFRCSIPRCGSTSVLEIHHIDEDASNHDSTNLLVLCSICHARITRGEIDQKACRMIKQAMLSHGASQDELLAIKDTIFSEMRRLVGQQDVSRPLDEAEKGNIGVPLGVLDSSGRPENGLVPVRPPFADDLRIDEKAAIMDARALTEVDYIFFRRYSDGRSSVISAYVVDNTDDRLTHDGLAQLHRKVWLRGTVPLLYVFQHTHIDLLACARGADFWRDDEDRCHYNPVKCIQIAGDITNELKRLAEGTFWEDPANRELADYTKASHQCLIQAVVEADRDLRGKENPTLRHLLLLMVLIKYLEDRRVFPEGRLSQFRPSAETFFDILRGGDPSQVYECLDALESRFDGDIFALPRVDITSERLHSFARLVEARTIGHQRYLWTSFHSNTCRWRS